MNNILLSIVVPTKNRYEYLFQLMDLLATFDSDEFEMVIQDNSDDNSEFLNKIQLEKYPFVEYFYQKEPLSQSGNSDQSILNSKGEYVCFIGDDDGVTRSIVDVVKWMKKENYSILKSAITVFKWPSFLSEKHYDVSGSVLFNKYTKTYRDINCKQALKGLLQSGIDTLGNMPKVYNGIVKRNILDLIYNKCGTFFPGPSPDMANAVALSLVEEKYVYVDYPIIIGGHSVNLGANAGRYKRGLGPLEDQKFIDQKYKDGWSARIPKVWASQTVWPESALTALKAFSADEFMEFVDYELILKKFANSHPDYFKLAYNLSTSKRDLTINFILRRIIYPFLHLKKYYSFKRKNLYGGLLIHRGYVNIAEAEELLMNEVGYCFNGLKKV